VSRRATIDGQHEVSRARIVQGLKALHTPFDIYEKCGHNHALNDPRAFEIEGLGMVCADGVVDTVCTHCCTDLVNGTYVVREVCIDEHKHISAYALCPTIAIIEGRDREMPWRP
jgi:hypothetical protein